MSCSIIRNKETNEVEKVLAPNGQESLLYKKLLETPDIDGLLVGGASLISSEFLAICLSSLNSK